MAKWTVSTCYSGSIQWKGEAKDEADAIKQANDAIEKMSWDEFHKELQVQETNQDAWKEK